MKTQLLSFILIFTILIKTEPSADLIKETREKTAQINITFLRNNYPEVTFINELGKLLSIIEQEKLPRGISIKNFKNGITRVVEAYKAFEKFFQSKPEVDTLKKVFRVINNEFNSLFGNYFLDELKKSSKKKIILFSTSMSCECTLEMCYKQEAEIQKLQKENPGLFDYAVVDCYTNYNLQSKNKVGFIPTAIIYDTKYKEVKRFAREENLNEIVNYILNTN